MGVKQAGIPSICKSTTDRDVSVLLRYTDIFIGTPKVEEDYIQSDITPQQCRLRDMTYSAPISVDIEYTRGKEVIVKKGKNGVGAVTIGKLPLMLRSGRYCANLLSQHGTIFDS